MLETLAAAPVLVKVLVSLGLILAVNAVVRNLVASVAVGAVVLAIWAGHPAADIGRIALARVTAVRHLLMLGTIVEVIWLSSAMAEAGMMRDLVAAVQARTGRRGSMAVLPAVVGFLPMPGGALFSAPLVGQCDERGEVEPGLKAKTNYWFRHIWEYWWPLYPGVLLALDLTKLDLWKFAAVQFPMTLVVVAAGAVFLLRRIPPEDLPPRPARAAGRRPRVLPLVAPILVVIATYGVVRLGWYGAAGAGIDLPELPGFVPMMPGLALAMLWIQWRRPLGRTTWRRILASRRTLVLLVIVATVNIYGGFVSAELPSGETPVDVMRGELDAWGIPLMAMILAIPFVAGLTTGLAFGFVGASFPIVLNLVAPDAGAGTYLSTVVVAYAFGYMGMMLSPLHVCLIVSSEHFGAPLGRNIRRLVAPAIAVMAAALGYWALLRWML